MIKMVKKKEIAATAAISLNTIMLMSNIYLYNTLSD